MINFLREQLAMRRLRKRLHAYTRMDRVFFHSTRDSFIELARQRAGTRTVATAYNPGFRYATVALVAVLALTSGLSVFADKNDVSPESSLYNLKRLGEEVRVAVAPAEKKVELREKLVDRRLKEIAVLKDEAGIGAELATQDISETMSLKMAPTDFIPVTAPSISPDVSSGSKDEKDDKEKRERNLKDKKEIVEKLTKDLYRETEKILDQVQKTSIKEENRERICNKIIDALYQDGASPSIRFAEQVQDRCEDIKED